jgi:pimeloyl-ACP methyl ester carboxylesterase
VDQALKYIAPLVSTMLSDSAPSATRLALQSLLNGIIGDRLEETGNALALEMSLFRDGDPLTLERAALQQKFPRAGRRLLVMVHGSSMNDLQWRREHHDYGTMLEQTSGRVVLYLRYNSGLHISMNGRALAHLLERLMEEWPEPVDELALVCHSMGGLVARSACDIGERERHAWRTRITDLVCLASPHHGAALERAGNWVDVLLEISPYSAPLAALGKIRSAGVTDLRHGNVRDEDWAGADRFARRKEARIALPLPDGVRCYAIAATRSPSGTQRLRSDGLVSVKSALGIHERAELRLHFPEANCFIAHETDHVGVLDSAAVQTVLHRWLVA